MIRMNPAHDTVNPPGCYSSQQANVIQQEKPLEKAIDEYHRGYKDGWRDGVTLCIPDAFGAKRTSEFDR